MRLAPRHAHAAIRTGRAALRGAAARLARDRAGATSIEYALICSLVFLAFLGGAQLFGNRTVLMYNHIIGNMP